MPHFCTPPQRYKTEALWGFAIETPPAGTLPCDGGKAPARKRQAPGETGSRRAKEKAQSGGQGARAQGAGHPGRATNSHRTTSLIIGIVYKATNRWRILCKPAAGGQGARQSSPAVRRCGVPPDNVDGLIECDKIVSYRGFLREI